MYIDDKIDEHSALRSFAEEYQFNIDGFCNIKIADSLVDRFENPS